MAEQAPAITRYILSVHQARKDGYPAPLPPSTIPVGDLSYEWSEQDGTITVRETPAPHVAMTKALDTSRIDEELERAVRIVASVEAELSSMNQTVSILNERRASVEALEKETPDDDEAKQVILKDQRADLNELLSRVGNIEELTEAKSKELEGAKAELARLEKEKRANSKKLAEPREWTLKV